MSRKKKSEKQYQPACELCGDHGFTGCPEAITDRGDLIELAFKKGVACICVEGRWFGERQVESWSLEELTLP